MYVHEQLLLLVVGATGKALSVLTTPYLTVEGKEPVDLLGVVWLTKSR
jgi:hypothetical protein